MPVTPRMIAAMRSESASDLVHRLANELEPEGPGKIINVTTEPPICGTVVAMGRPICDECRQPVSIDVSVGDVVVYHKMSGLEIEIDREAHVMLKPHDVLLIWRPDSVKES